MTVIISAYCDCNSGYFIVAIPYMWVIKEVVIIPIHPVIKYMLIKANVKAAIRFILGEILGFFIFVCLNYSSFY